MRRRTFAAAVQPARSILTCINQIVACDHYKLDKNRSINFEIKKVQIRSDVSIDGVGRVARVKVDPLLVGVGIGYRF